MSLIGFRCDRETLKRIDAAVDEGLAKSREDFVYQTSLKAVVDALDKIDAKREADAEKAKKKKKKERNGSGS